MTFWWIFNVSNATKKPTRNQSCYASFSGSVRRYESGTLNASCRLIMLYISKCICSYLDVIFSDNPLTAPGRTQQQQEQYVWLQAAKASCKCQTHDVIADRKWKLTKQALFWSSNNAASSDENNIMIKRLIRRFEINSKLSYLYHICRHFFQRQARTSFALLQLTTVDFWSITHWLCEKFGNFGLWHARLFYTINDSVTGVSAFTQQRLALIKQI